MCGLLHGRWVRSNRIFQNHPIYYVTAQSEPGGPTADFVLKVHKAESSAREEFQTLTRVNGHFKNLESKFEVPTAFAVLPELPGLLMSRVPGKRLDKIMLTASADSIDKCPGIVDAVRRAASWLSFYQRMNPHNGHHHTLFGHELQSTLQTALELGRNRLDTSIVNTVDRWSRETDFSSVSSKCVPIACGHNGFVPGHIFETPDKISVVDFSTVLCGWPGEDLAAFLVALATRIRISGSVLSQIKSENPF